MWIVKTLFLSFTYPKNVSWHEMLAMHTSAFSYYQDWHKKPDRRSLSRTAYQVLQTVWSISWRKAYSISLLIPVIPASFGPLPLLVLGGRFISVMLDQFCWTDVKRGKLLLRMRWGCMGWSIVWSGCVGWDWLIVCWLMFFVIGRCCCEDWGYDNSKLSDVVWSCHARRHQFPNTWGYGAWNNWEKEEGSTKEIVGRVPKEGFEMIWLEKTGCIKKMVRAN